MATSRASHLKEKVASASSSPSTVGHKSPRPPGSPNRLPSTTPDKPTTHNYLKSKSSISATKSTAPKSTTNAKSTVKKPTDVKPPSPVRRPERTLSAPKPRSPSPLPRPSKATNSHALDRKGPKPLTKSSSTISGRTARNNPLTRSKSLEKKKEIVATPSAFVDKSEASNNKDEVGAMEEQDHSKDVAAQETNNVEEHEGKQADILIIENENENENENEHEMVNDEAVAEETKQDEAMESVAVEESPKKAEPETQLETEERVQSTEVPATVTASAVSSKKEAHLSNDVIEEAKSKFLEKRKNKVLALVGAFETVMALQEPDGQQQPKKDKEVDEGNSNANESTEST